MVMFAAAAYSFVPVVDQLWEDIIVNIVVPISSSQPAQLAHNKRAAAAAAAAAETDIEVQQLGPIPIAEATQASSSSLSLSL